MEKDALIQQEVNYLYSNFSHALSDMNEQHPDDSRLLVIGERHRGSDAGIAHIAALKASIDQYGEENTILSVELSTDVLPSVEQDILLGKFDNILENGGEPHIQAIKYALDNNIKIVGNDIATIEDVLQVQATQGTHLYDINEDRERYMKNTASFAAMHPHQNEPVTVIQLNGSAHLSGLQGRDENIIPQQQQVNNQQLEQIFGNNIRYFNSASNMLALSGHKAVDDSMNLEEKFLQWSSNESYHVNSEHNDIIQLTDSVKHIEELYEGKKQQEIKVPIADLPYEKSVSLVDDVILISKEEMLQWQKENKSREPESNLSDDLELGDLSPPNAPQESKQIEKKDRSI